MEYVSCGGVVFCVTKRLCALPSIPALSIDKTCIHMYVYLGFPWMVYALSVDARLSVHLLPIALQLIAAVVFAVRSYWMKRNATASQEASSARLEELRGVQTELMERRRRIREQIENEKRKRKRLLAKAAKLTRSELLALAANAK